MTLADGPELTIDELASRVGMTVRNVRAYASRGLIPAPRLEGRTGYYGPAHVQRLRLVRTLLDRGYTLSAVERAVTGLSGAVDGHALDLLEVLGSPLALEEEPEVISRDELAALAGLERDETLADRLVGAGLAELVDDDRVRLLRPSVVRSGAAAIALGLSPGTVLGLLPELDDSLRRVALTFVTRVRAEIWQPFVEAGMPEDDWDRVLRMIDALLPVAGQSVLAVFRDELGAAIHDAMGEELGALGSGTER